MGFEEVGIVLRDMKTNQIFSINELHLEEQEDWIRREMQKRGLTKMDPATKQDIDMMLD